MVRLAAAALLPLALAAGPRGTWTGTWSNEAVGTAGPARLVAAKTLELRLSGPALGCARPTTLPVHLAKGRLRGHGRDVPCNHGLRWSLAARRHGSTLAGTLRLRLADGSRAVLALALRRR